MEMSGPGDRPRGGLCPTDHWPRRASHSASDYEAVGRQDMLFAPVLGVVQIDGTSPGISRPWRARRHEIKTSSPTTAIRLRSKTRNPACLPGGCASRLGAGHRRSRRFRRRPPATTGRKSQCRIPAAPRPRGGEETLPKCLSRPLLAVAEERPANAALVILSARERQRQQEDTSITLSAFFTG